MVMESSCGCDGFTRQQGGLVIAYILTDTLVMVAREVMGTW